jgi:hypothetical protein
VGFEQIVGYSDPERGKCLKCGGYRTRALISKFAVGGRGDLRESTLHGCENHSLHSDHAHEPHEGHSHEGHAHESSHEDSGSSL